MQDDGLGETDEGARHPRCCRIRRGGGRLGTFGQEQIRRLLALDPPVERIRRATREQGTSGGIAPAREVRLVRQANADHANSSP